MPVVSEAAVASDAVDVFAGGLTRSAFASRTQVPILLQV